jgi:glycosyltransferase involved in cell wall biosynthesis
VGTIGRLSQEKGHRYLLRAASEIVSKYPKTVFLIIGDGPLKTELEKEFGSASVFFTGNSNDVSEWYRAMDIFVLPSLTEGLPMALLEAVASKVPVIASRVGAIPSLIINGETGMLIEPGNVKSMKQALGYMLEHRAQAERLSDQAYQRIRSEYSAAKMAEQYMKIYRGVAA